MRSLGRYELIEQLGQGSMGTVHKARDPLLGRDVAIKQILVQPGDGPEATEFRERFFREARAAGRLSHPGIVTVFDVSEHEGTPFLVMEYVAGRTLLSVLQNGERMSLDRACDVGIQLAEALDYAHRNGVIHRDIKPANILVTDDGRIKIADFGVAKLIESQLTVRGQLLGTPAFMAPEQFIGMPIDARSDLFSAGVVIYCMTTGEKPFAGDTVIGIQYKVMHTEPVEPRKLNPAISSRLDEVILKSIQKDPLQRYPSGEELARDLRLCLSGAPAGTGSRYEPTVLMAPKRQPGERPHRRSSVGMIALIPFLAGFFAFAAVYLVKNTRRTATQAANNSSVIAPAGAATTLPTDTANERPVEAIPSPKDVTPEQATGGGKSAKAGVAVEAAKVAQPQRVSLSDGSSAPPALSTTQRETPIASVAAIAPERESNVLPADQLPPKVINEPVAAPAPQEATESYKSARLLIASVAVPEGLTIIVNVDNELFFSRNGTGGANPTLEEHAGRIQLQTISSVPLSEERTLPPGKHKIQVNVMLASRRVSKVQEISERFHSGQRRILEIEFLPEVQVSHGHEAALFKINLK